MINSELHFELADPYLEEENILWQPRGSHDSSVDSWSLWPSGKARSLGRALSSTLAHSGDGFTGPFSWGQGIVGPSRGDSPTQITYIRVHSSSLCLPSCVALGTLGELAKLSLPIRKVVTHTFPTGTIGKMLGGTCLAEYAKHTGYGQAWRELQVFTVSLLRASGRALVSTALSLMSLPM